MSRIGKMPIPIPQGVTVNILDGNVVEVKGPKGALKKEFHPEMKIEIVDNAIVVKRNSDKPFYKALHGTTRALLNNMVVGVTKGFSKRLIINEKTYKGEVKGRKVQFELGYSHPILMDIPEGLNVTIEGQVITVSGIDKEAVGAFAQKIRHLRKVDPYKVKGIIYEGEKIRRKAGKTVASGK
ncbi:50S ribosomal protein L6 [Caldisericum exile]|uniref:Large ribosomal subunit protein uL6 n=1 Tax=Caldisericum exile (strain DSM 21853 / NBRC 104410 / AZM16c01) TaxID=511051 RepID=A0A7U6GF97_CALEA|nr:50S ribosomal protein L6 [Caldisericum exile]BAL81252.1 50S ribosomal protein L6 [Caldisericum exile AZM16c01]